MGKDEGYGLRNPAPAVEIGYILGVCLKQDTQFATLQAGNPVEPTQSRQWFIWL
jgi:hypothetical protein